MCAKEYGMRFFRNVSRSILALLLVCATAHGAPAPGKSGAPAVATELTISAAISLKDSLDEIRTSYIAQHAGTQLAMNYGASGTLELQIGEGAPVDVFFSAAPKQMDQLEAKGLLASGSRRDLLRNEIVLIVPKDSKTVTSFKDLLNPNVKHVALGEPTSVPAGQYAQQVLNKLGIAQAVNAKAVFAKDVRQVLTYVETGDADAGIVYATDARSSHKVRVVAQAPEDSHAPVIYSVGVIKGSKNAAAAMDFEAFLSGPQARAIFQKYGFRTENP
jgi:molybdate transport system substrate-binding protein